MRTEFANRQECKRYLTEYLGSEYGMYGNGARLCGFCEWRAFTKRAA